MNIFRPYPTLLMLGLLVLMSGCGGGTPQLNIDDDQLIIVESAKDFKARVLTSDVPVLVDFWASWCGVCRKMNPMIAETAIAFDGVMAVAKINIDDNRDLAQRFHIRALPTMMIFHEGKVIAAYEGAMRRKAFDQWLKKHLNQLGIDLSKSPA